MKEFIYKFLIFLLLMGITSSALCFSGAYLVFQGGFGGIYTKYHSANNDPYSTVRLRDGLSNRSAVGWLTKKFLVNYGIELGYAGYPTNQYHYLFPSLNAAGTLKYNGYNVDLLGVMEYRLRSHFQSKLYLSGKAGVSRVTQKFTGQASALGTVFNLSQTVSQYRPEIALGTGFHLNNTLTFDISWYHIFASMADPSANSVSEQNTLTQVSSVSTLMIGLTYRF